MIYSIVNWIKKKQTMNGYARKTLFSKLTSIFTNLYLTTDIKNVKQFKKYIFWQPKKVF